MGATFFWGGGGQRVGIYRARDGNQLSVLTPPQRSREALSSQMASCPPTSQQGPVRPEPSSPQQRPWGSAGGASALDLRNTPSYSTWQSPARASPLTWVGGSLEHSSHSTRPRVVSALSSWNGQAHIILGSRAMPPPTSPRMAWEPHHIPSLSQTDSASSLTAMLPTCTVRSLMYGQSPRPWSLPPKSLLCAFSPPPPVPRLPWTSSRLCLHDCNYLPNVTVLPFFTQVFRRLKCFSFPMCKME